MIARLLLIIALFTSLAACGGNADASSEAGSRTNRAVADAPLDIKERDTDETTLTLAPDGVTTTTVTPPTTTVAPTTTTTQPPATTTTLLPPEPVVAASGFSYLPDGDLSYAVILENPTTDAALLSMWLDLNFVDDQNRITETTIEVVEFLLPGAQTALGGSLFDPPDDIVAIEVDGDWDFVRVEDAEPGIWSVSELAYEDGFFEQVTGFVSHTFPQDMDVVQMTAVFYDEAGNIVGGDWGFVDVPAGREVAFEISLFDPPDFATFEVFVAP